MFDGGAKDKRSTPAPNPTEGASKGPTEDPKEAKTEQSPTTVTELEE
tara:strand:+ start:3396 stop:3536 length:141 start_codon:yes stop_codon:yes gene_type:complete